MRANYLALTSIVVLTGCAHPLVRPDDLASSQFKVEDVADWETLASRTAVQLEYKLGGYPNGPVALVGNEPARETKGGAPLFIDVEGSSAFSDTFKPLLEKQLIARGFTIVPAPLGAHVVEVEAKTFLYNPQRRLKSPVQYATFWTTAYGIGALARNVASLDTGVAIAEGGGVVADLLFAMNGQTNAEVLVLTSVSDTFQVYYRGSEEFYVRPSDLPLYWADQRSTSTRCTPVWDQRTCPLYFQDQPSTSSPSPSPPSNLNVVELPVRAAPQDIIRGGR
jgi:hypothetical protein